MKLFLAPHNDDEALFGAYTIMREKPLVVVVTDSWLQGLRGLRVTAEQRRRESEEAMRILGVQIEFLGIKDNELKEQILIAKLKKYAPKRVYAPAIQGGNEQHDLVGKVANRLWNGKVLFYSTYTKDNLTLSGKIEVKPTPEEMKLKNEALNCYKSQISVNGPHFRAVRKKSEYLNRGEYEEDTQRRSKRKLIRLQRGNG